MRIWTKTPPAVSAEVMEERVASVTIVWANAIEFNRIIIEDDCQNEIHFLQKNSHIYYMGVSPASRAIFHAFGFPVFVQASRHLHSTWWEQIKAVVEKEDPWLEKKPESGQRSSSVQNGRPSLVGLTRTTKKSVVTNL